jgi:outer membrane protein assembly factor BamB
MVRRLLVFCLLPVACCLLLGADWPQWLGPNRDGISPEAVEPWKGELKVLWRYPVGEGHSSPIVAQGRVFVHARVQGQEKEEVIAYDAKTGKELWRSSYERPPFKNQFGNGPRSTPLVENGKVYSLGVTGMLACWDAETGKEVWRLDVLKEFNAPNLFFGVSSSPIIEGDKLLVMVGGPEASIVAFDKNTGKVAWKSGKDKASYASPMVTTYNGRRAAVFLTREGVLALNPADGQPYWQFPLVDKLNESSTTPVRVGDILFASSVTYGSVGLRLTTKDDQPAYEQVWKNEQLTCYFATPVPVGEHLYAVTGRIIPPAAALHCVEAKTGKVLWSKRNVGKYHATVLRVKDRLLLLEEQGQLALIEPDPKEYRELSRTKICGFTWAHPALSNGLLYVRDEKELLCVPLAANP